MKYLKLYENKNSKELYIIATQTYSDSTNYEYQWDNEFENQQEALKWIFDNYWVDIDPELENKRRDIGNDMIYGEDIKIVKINDADIDEALDNIIMKVQAKKYNL